MPTIKPIELEAASEASANILRGFHGDVGADRALDEAPGTRPA